MYTSSEAFSMYSQIMYKTIWRIQANPLEPYEPVKGAFLPLKSTSTYLCCSTCSSFNQETLKKHCCEEVVGSK